VRADPKTVWRAVTVRRYEGSERTLEFATETALWSHNGTTPLPIRWVLSRDPKGASGPRCSSPESIDLSDREVPPILQVIEWERETIVLHALCSGRDPAGSWDLHCPVRERLVTFIQGLDGGRFLPRRRVELVDTARPDGEDGGHPGEAEAHGNGVVPDRDRHHVG
jgi:hypothetical protein